MRRGFAGLVACLLVPAYGWGPARDGPPPGAAAGAGAAHGSSVMALAVDPVGGRVLSGSADGTVRLWGIEGEALRPGVEARLGGGVVGVALGALEGAWVLDDRGEVSTLGLAGERTPLAHHEGGALALALDAEAGTGLKGTWGSHRRTHRRDAEDAEMETSACVTTGPGGRPLWRKTGIREVVNDLDEASAPLR